MFMLPLAQSGSPRTVLDPTLWHRGQASSALWASVFLFLKGEDQHWRVGPHVPDIILYSSLHLPLPFPSNTVTTLISPWSPHASFILMWLFLGPPFCIPHAHTYWVEVWRWCGNASDVLLKPGAQRRLSPSRRKGLRIQWRRLKQREPWVGEEKEKTCGSRII